MRPQVPWGSGPAPAAVAWIPHALSLCGLTCGFLSLLASVAGDFPAAAAFIIAAIFFDGFDGAAARALRCDGAFGETMDSLSDLVAFGIAPAFLAYQANLYLFGTAGAFSGAAFAACGAIRLARFPLVKSSGTFVGLPIPMAGGFLAMLGVYASEVHPVLVPAATLVLGLLMVSTIQFPKFSTAPAVSLLPPPLRWALCLALAPILFIWSPKVILALLAAYVLVGLATEVRSSLGRAQR